MGVTQLWSVLHPCARPTKFEALNRKRLAVDASIWIYQFLKAVRDKEGNALRNSHVVGFFRRICKLLYFGIKPVFVFDGGAPALKRQTILGRKRRREGRRDDAARTAGKLLAMQMQRRAEDAEEKRKREIEVRGRPTEAADEEEIPDNQNLVYVDELGMSKQERQQSRKFVKKDAYHLPDLNGDISNMGQPNDPRIMSSEELEEFARQHNSGENVDLYDFSKIDFDGDFFKCLPPADRYNILNAARLRSRLRMGLSKEQLEEMFPDRMAFSKFQVERVRERNELTQRLMNLNGMNGEDAMFGVGSGRIAGERGREYILVKNEGVEGGWALGVVSKDREQGERNKPIDIDALHERTKVKAKDEEELEDEDEFEDVPVEGLNRLPTEQQRYQAQMDHIKKLQMQDEEDHANQMKASTDSLFVEQDQTGDLFEADEEEQLNRAIAMSLQKSFGGEESEDEEVDFEDVQMPTYQQKAAKTLNPLSKSSGNGLIHIVNNRANAALPKRQAVESSDEEENLQAVLAGARKQKAPSTVNSFVRPSGNLFGGALPFEKLDLKRSIFSGGANDRAKGDKASENDKNLAGGFERDDGQEKAWPLPPWLASTGDIRSDVKEQLAKDQEINAADHERRLEEERLYQRDYGIIEVESSDEGSDVEIIEAPVPTIDLTDDAEREEVGLSTPDKTQKSGQDSARIPSDKFAFSQQSLEEKVSGVLEDLGKETSVPSEDEPVEWSESDRDEPSAKKQDENSILSQGFEASKNQFPSAATPAKSPSPEFEDVELNKPTAVEELQFPPRQEEIFTTEKDDDFDRQVANPISDGEFDEFSDPEDEELLAQLELEAEEHARFASTLNNKAPRLNQDDYEHELKQLRNQQKKDRRDADDVSHIMITECQALLRLFGLPYITAPMEAEAQCAELVTLGLVDGIITDDSDVFLFGGTRVYKNMFNSNKFVECYLASDLEKELSLTRDKLIEFAHLLGSDYTEGLPGIGPVTALEIISEFASDNGLQEFKEWWFDVQHNNRPKEADSKSTFRKKFRRAQGTKLFLPPGFPSQAVSEAYKHADVDSTPDPFQWGVPDLDNLRSFLMATIGWTPERTDEVLVPVIKDMNRREAEGTQTNITRYFDGAVGAGAKDSSGRVGANKGTSSVRMKEAMRKLKSNTASNNLLNTTFADEAAEWAKKNELSETAQLARQAKKQKPKKRALREEDGEADDESVEEVTDETAGSSRQTASKRGRNTRGKKAKVTE